MMRSTRSLGWFGWAMILGVGLLPVLGTVASADEPPPPDTEVAPPPAPAETEPPLPVPEPAPTKDEPPAWSPPALPIPPAEAEARPAELPPPVVRTRTRTAPSTRPADELPIKDVPSEFPTAEPPEVPQPESFPAPTTQPAPQVTKPATTKREEGRIPIAVTPSLVQSITKTHNVPRKDGERVLKLDVEYEVVGEAGRDVYVGVWFVRKEKDQYLRSAMWQYGDPQRYLTVQTRPGRVGTRCSRYLATLEIPYAAFPMRKDEEEYDVEARVHVLRRESGSRMTVLARGETTFTVHAGPAEPSMAAPSTQMAPAPRAVPTETGTIEEPGVLEGAGPRASPSPTGIIEDVLDP